MQMLRTCDCPLFKVTAVNGDKRTRLSKNVSMTRTNFENILPLSFENALLNPHYPYHLKLSPIFLRLRQTILFSSALDKSFRGKAR